MREWRCGFFFGVLRLRSDKLKHGARAICDLCFCGGYGYLCCGSLFSFVFCAMPEDLLRYDLLIENALREVVRQTLAKVAKDGLPGEHHFYITFQTHAPDVAIPARLREQYPDEMTIVLQHQFFNLKAEEDGFSVMLSFNNVREKLSIPYAAISTFADPSVNFALQFQSGTEEDEEEPSPDDTEAADDKKDEAPKEEKRGEVISLDMFRKK